MKQAQLFFTTLLMLGLGVIPAQAQRPAGGISPGSGSPATDQPEVELDTFDIFYFRADNPNQEIPYSDTTLGNYFTQYDPVRHRDLDYRHLGNLGSAHEPIVFQAADRRGFTVGFSQFDLYINTGNTMPYFRVERPFSKVSYVLGSEQADGYTTAQLGRNFANGVSYSLDYSRINQLGEREQYPNQNTRNTSFSNGLKLESKRGRYQSFFSYIINTIEQEDNGGIAIEPASDEDFNTATSAIPFLGDARTRHAHRELMYTQYFRFGGGVDSIRGPRRSYTIAHQAMWRNSTYKYSDDFDFSPDSAFYANAAALLPDVRGVRLSFRHRQLENSVRLATFRLSGKQRDAAKNQRDLFEVGAVHTWHDIAETESDTTLNNLFLTGRYRFNPSERLLLDLNAHLGLWDNAGDYKLSGVLYFDLKKLGSLRLEGLNQLYAPTLMQHRLRLSDRPAYRNDFSKTLSTTLSATYELPALRLRATGRYHLLNNFIYFDTTGLPVQTGIPLSIGQLIVQKDFKIGSFHLDNTVALQQASEDFLRLPTVYSKHSLYYQGLWFKALNVRTGFDLRMNNSYFAHYYNPVTGQFQLQNRREVEFYPATDVFFSLRVTKFRAFIRWENATALLTPGEFFYQTAFYPHYNAVFRIGIDWRFLN